MSAGGSTAAAHYGNWCHVTGCTNPRLKNSMGGRCNKHNHRLKVNGDPLQKKIKLMALTACEKKTQVWINKAKREPTWDAQIMDALRRNLESAAKDIAFDLNQYLNHGKALRNGIRNALRILNAWHTTYTPEERLRFWLAVQYFYMHYPKSFASFEGYKAQVVQLMYRRSGIKVGKMFTTESFKGKAEGYPSLPVPRYMFDFVWEHLFGIFGGIAHHMNRLYNIEERRQKAAQATAEFFSQVKPSRLQPKKPKRCLKI
jgi:hypothetical protein